MTHKTTRWLLCLVLVLAMVASVALAACNEQATATFAGGTDATGEAPSAQSGAIGDSITLPQNTFTREGYTFAGWSDGSATYQAGDSYELTADVTFTAQWTENQTTPPATKHTLSFALGAHAASGATAPASVELEEGATTTLPQAPAAEEGWEFAGWGESKLQAGATYTMPASDTTLTAQWTEKTTPPTPTEPLLTSAFDGTLYDESGHYITFGSSAIEAGKYSFDFASFSIEKSATGLYTISKDGIEFFDISGESKIGTGSFDGRTLSVSITAADKEWKLSGEMYCISISGLEASEYYLNAGAPVVIALVYYNTENETVTFNGEPFDIDAQLEAFADGGEYTKMPAENCTAEFQTTEYTLSFELGDHAASDATTPASEELKAGATTTLPQAPAAEEGWEFVGWNDGYETFDAGAEYQMPGEDTVMTAQWKQSEPTEKKYTLTLEVGDHAILTGPVYMTMEFRAGAQCVLPQGPLSTDEELWEFVGWGEDKLQPGDIFVMPAEDTTLVAQWKKIGSLPQEWIGEWKQLNGDKSLTLELAETTIIIGEESYEITEGESLFFYTIGEESYEFYVLNEGSDNLLLYFEYAGEEETSIAILALDGQSGTAGFPEEYWDKTYEDNMSQGMTLTIDESGSASLMGSTLEFIGSSDSAIFALVDGGAYEITLDESTITFQSLEYEEMIISFIEHQDTPTPPPAEDIVPKGYISNLWKQVNGDKSLDVEITGTTVIFDGNTYNINESESAPFSYTIGEESYEFRAIDDDGFGNFNLIYFELPEERIAILSYNGEISGTFNTSYWDATYDEIITSNNFTFSIDDEGNATINLGEELQVTVIGSTVTDGSVTSTYVLIGAAAYEITYEGETITITAFETPDFSITFTRHYDLTFDAQYKGTWIEYKPETPDSPDTLIIDEHTVSYQDSSNWTIAEVEGGGYSLSLSGSVQITFSRITSDDDNLMLVTYSNGSASIFYYEDVEISSSLTVPTADEGYYGNGHNTIYSDGSSLTYIWERTWEETEIYAIGTTDGSTIIFTGRTVATITVETDKITLTGEDAVEYNKAENPFDESIIGIWTSSSTGFEIIFSATAFSYGGEFYDITIQSETEYTFQYTSSAKWTLKFVDGGTTSKVIKIELSSNNIWFFTREGDETDLVFPEQYRGKTWTHSQFDDNATDNIVVDSDGNATLNSNPFILICQDGNSIYGYGTTAYGTTGMVCITFTDGGFTYKGVAGYPNFTYEEKLSPDVPEVESPKDFDQGFTGYWRNIDQTKDYIYITGKLFFYRYTNNSHEWFDYGKYYEATDTGSYSYTLTINGKEYTVQLSEDENILFLIENDTEEVTYFAKGTWNSDDSLVDYAYTETVYTEVFPDAVDSVYTGDTTALRPKTYFTSDNGPADIYFDDRDYTSANEDTEYEPHAYLGNETIIILTWDSSSRKGTLIAGAWYTFELKGGDTAEDIIIILTDWRGENSYSYTLKPVIPTIKVPSDLQYSTFTDAEGNELYFTNNSIEYTPKGGKAETVYAEIDGSNIITYTYKDKTYTITGIADYVGLYTTCEGEITVYVSDTLSYINITLSNVSQLEGTTWNSSDKSITLKVVAGKFTISGKTITIIEKSSYATVSSISGILYYDGNYYNYELSLEASNTSLKFTPYLPGHGEEITFSKEDQGSGGGGGSSSDSSFPEQYQTTWIAGIFNATFTSNGLTYNKSTYTGDVIYDAQTGIYSIKDQGVYVKFITDDLGIITIPLGTYVIRKNDATADTTVPSEIQSTYTDDSITITISNGIKITGISLLNPEVMHCQSDNDSGYYLYCKVNYNSKNVLAIVHIDSNGKLILTVVGVEQPMAQLQKAE